ncbi:MAG: YihY/virulence factor BrkB family protein [candidate division Zixibacteria bacterium]|nr:YihY/virulence factor BrkB family protein [candidate division Zixibacteria bacterium]
MSKFPFKNLDMRHLKKFIAHYGGGLYERVDSHHVFLLASGLAFSIFICVIPLILIVFAAVSAILEQPRVGEQIRTLMSQVIPYEDYANYVVDLLLARINEFARYKNQAGIIGTFGLLFAASGLFSSMRTALNTIFRVSVTQSVLIGKLRDLGLVVVVLIFFLISVTILPTVKVAKEFAENTTLLQGLYDTLIGGLALHAVSWALVFISFAVVYFALPQGKVRRCTIIVSSLWATALWHVAQYAFGWYIGHFLTFERVYGAYALIVVVAFWIYYASLVFVMGAEVGQLYGERHPPRFPMAREPEEPPPRKKVDT